MFFPTGMGEIGYRNGYPYVFKQKGVGGYIYDRT